MSLSAACFRKKWCRKCWMSDWITGRCHCPFKNTWFSLEEEKWPNWGSKSCSILCGWEFARGGKGEPTGQIGSGRGGLFLRSEQHEETGRHISSSSKHAVQKDVEKEKRQTFLWNSPLLIECFYIVKSWSLLSGSLLCSSTNPTISCKIVSHLKGSSSSCGIIYM